MGWTFATTLVCLRTYALFVRNSRIGMLLNGRKYPFGLPENPPSNDGLPLCLIILGHPGNKFRELTVVLL